MVGTAANSGGALRRSTGLGYATFCFASTLRKTSHSRGTLLAIFFSIAVF
jgi:hypothetical protein